MKVTTKQESDIDMADVVNGLIEDPAAFVEFWQMFDLALVEFDKDIAVFADALAKANYGSAIPLSLETIVDTASVHRLKKRIDQARQRRLSQNPNGGDHGTGS